MPELDFKVVSAEAARHAATPTLRFQLAIYQRRPQVPIQNVALQCQIRIDARKRRYQPGEQSRLTDLFGEPARWSQTLQSLLWTHASTAAPAFDTDCMVDLPVPCSFDFNLAATKYFHGIEDGAVPLLLLFSGSVFYRDADGMLAMDLIAANKEASYPLPVTVWQDLMETYYPNANWLCLNREVFERLYAYKRRFGYTGFDEALLSLLPDVEKVAS